MTLGPYDVHGQLMRVGDFVVWTTKDRDGTLSFGHIEKFYNEETDTDYRGNPRYSAGMRMTLTDSFGNPKFETVWDRTKGEYLDTDKQAKSGIVQYSRNKFMIMP